MTLDGPAHHRPRARGDGDRTPAEDHNPQQWYENELEKIRTEGDLALIRAQAERQHLAEVDAELAQLHKQLKEKKKQFARLSAAAGSGAVGDSAALAQAQRRHEQAQTQLEQRLKATVSAKTVELHRLRQDIDEARRQRLDGLASERQIVEETRRLEEVMRQSQVEVEGLKTHIESVRQELATHQSEHDAEKNEFRIERQRLQLDLDRIARPEKVAVKVNVLGRVRAVQTLTERSIATDWVAIAGPCQKFNVFHSISLTRKKRDERSRAKKLSMEQKVVSFEQKKSLLDRLITETGLQNLNDFIQQYNQQERDKAEILSRIEAKSFLNSSLNEAISQLEEDITRLSGAGDIQTIVHMEQPSELKRRIDADDALINQWTAETQAFTDALKAFREPIRELSNELFPQEREGEAFDTTINEVSMLRRVGAIEERVMQRVLFKILKETDSSHQSETFKRLQRYRGFAQSNHTTTSTANVDLSKRGSLDVAAPSLCEEPDAGDDDIDTHVMAIHADQCRPNMPLPPGSASPDHHRKTMITLPQ